MHTCSGLCQRGASFSTLAPTPPRRRLTPPRWRLRRLTARARATSPSLPTTRSARTSSLHLQGCSLGCRLQASGFQPQNPLPPSPTLSYPLPPSPTLSRPLHTLSPSLSEHALRQLLGLHTRRHAARARRPADARMHCPASSGARTRRCRAPTPHPQAPYSLLRAPYAQVQA